MGMELTRRRGICASFLGRFTDLIRFMTKEAENLMKGCVHKDDLFIVHDALVLMTAKETIDWMKDKNYYHRWLLPMNGLQDGLPYA